VEKTRRRLYVKILLRRARALELLGELAEEGGSVGELRRVLHVEPENPEAKQLLAKLTAPAPAPVASAEAREEALPAEEAVGGALPSTHGATDPDVATVKGDDSGTARATGSGRGRRGQRELDDDIDEPEDVVDHASITALLSSAAEYMRKNDYESALQIYGYARRRCKVWESPALELKALSNTSLCLQRLRGRLPELIAACNEALGRIAELRGEPDCGGVAEELLLNMECACLARRSTALAQQGGKATESERDAARVRELLARKGAMEDGKKASPAAPDAAGVPAMPAPAG
jgi:hypothetical protein